MPREKTCSNCLRIYRGSGYNEVCTRDCYFKYEYARNHNKNVRSEAVYKPKHHIKTIEEYNSDFKNSKQKKEIDPVVKRKNKKYLEKLHVSKDRWTGKKFQACRG